ncbi:MAG: bifunctional biotin--[acetyl-CoA-carboxylase] synthetase/biotin operon repressor, partial [Anaerolineae bacterium]|nr:bifunctional biotin--[acetyl-CoA-carboxylase] synthetase/biotin operon repressor [Anaerolineae bacterium]
MAEFTVEELQARLGTRLVGRQAELYETIDSTNTRAVQAAREGAPDGTLILAEWQSQGRGRLGRRWLAPAGSSLLLSLIFRPPLKPSQAQRMTMVCSLRAVAAIARVAG